MGTVTIIIKWVIVIIHKIVATGIAIFQIRMCVIYTCIENRNRYTLSGEILYAEGIVESYQRSGICKERLNSDIGIYRPDIWQRFYERYDAGWYPDLYRIQHIEELFKLGFSRLFFQPVYEFIMQVFQILSVFEKFRAIGDIQGKIDH